MKENAPKTKLTCLKRFKFLGLRKVITESPSFLTFISLFERLATTVKLKILCLYRLRPQKYSLNVSN